MSTPHNVSAMTAMLDNDNIRLTKIHHFHSFNANVTVLARSMLARTHKHELAAPQPFEMLRISGDG